MLAGPPSIATRTFAAAADHAEHPTYELAVDDSALVLMPCPGTKGADLQSSLEQLQGQGVQAILTLLSTEELEGKNVGTLGTIAEELGIKWFHLPISDDESPGEDFAAGWATASPILHDIMDNGGKVAVHCMGGSGRTGIGAAHLLLEKGWDLPKIIEQVQALRPGAFKKPDQIAYVESLGF
jgi:protein-tyrosine phosphatase